jgi:hypothetical protein
MPIVAATITPQTFMAVTVVINPPKVKITSDGIGGKMFSSQSENRSQHNKPVNDISITNLFQKIPPWPTYRLQETLSLHSACFNIKPYGSIST